MPDTQKNFYKKFLGRSGETLAVNFLKKHKYKILKTNFTCTVGEVDIIASKDGAIVFVEVKTRNSSKYGRPCEAVNSAKQNKYRNMAGLYLQREGLENAFVRFDVIEILDGEINHIENAF